jgi:N-acetylneuraminic acid mutarotase
MSDFHCASLIKNPTEW